MIAVLGITLARPEALHLLWGIAGVVGVLAWGESARRRSLAAFAETPLRALIARRRPGWSNAARLLLGPAALALVVVALARPLGRVIEREEAITGRDIVFVVDVSRSMLAEDLAPNRLERAKIWINDLVDSLSGDRVALVAFAGSAIVKCPLTSDYEFFRLGVADLSPSSVSRGGTLIGDALRAAGSDVLTPEADNAPEVAARDIILFTDGEDHESLPVDAARTLGERGVRIIALGLGEEGSGTPVPGEGGRFLTHEGGVVRSRQNPESLAKIARATPGGAYLNVGTGTIDLEDVYADLIASAAQTDLGARTSSRRKELFGYWLAAGLALLLFDALLGGIHARVRPARAPRAA